MPRVRLIEIAHGRSGDKGDSVNIGIIARRPEWYPVLLSALTPEVLRAWFSEICFGKIERYELRNLDALNFVLQQSLDGGGTVSLRSDAQGKTYSAALLRMEVELPEELATPFFSRQ